MDKDVAPPICDGRYRLVGRLGQGGMATVYQAWDTRLRVARAVKVLDPSLTEVEHLKQRFLTEARTIARLEHPHIVTVHDVDVDSDGKRVYIVMALLRGGTLMDRIERDGPLPAHMACGVILELLDALDAAHVEGVVHRDVKPQNVLLSRRGRVQLSDFGIARVADRRGRRTQTGITMGSPAYMPPEQRSDASQAGPQADLYSTAATLVQLVTGRDPYDLHSSDLRGRALAGVPEVLRAVIARATAYEPEERYASAPAMAAALRRALPELPKDPLAPPLVRHQRTLTDSWEEPTHRSAAVPSAPPGLAPAGRPVPTAVPGGHTPQPRKTVADHGPRDPASADTLWPDGSRPEAERSDTLWPQDAPVQRAPSEPGEAPTPARRARWIPAAALVGLLGLGAWWTLGLEEPPVEPERDAVQAHPVVPEPVPDVPAPVLPEPVLEESTQLEPAAEEPAPAVVKPEPVVEEPEPVVQEPEPVVEEPEPVVQEPEPVVEEPEPVVVEPEPVVEEPAAISGTLFVSSKPVSRVLVDGLEVGQTRLRESVTVGTHQVELVTEDGRRARQVVTITEGKQTSLCWDFALEAQCPR